MCRFVWTVEDWTLQELSSQYTGGLDRQDSRISATLDASLQSSKVGLHKQKYFSAIFWHDIVAESSSPPPPPTIANKNIVLKIKFAISWLLLRHTTYVP